jgi:hypothetical protein
MYIYIYIYIYVCIYLYRYTCILAYIHTYMHTYIFTLTLCAGLDGSRGGGGKAVEQGHATGTHFTCFTGTTVQILTQKRG